MRLDNDQDDKGMGMPVIYTIVAVSAFILVILGIVLITSNNNNAKKKNARLTPTPTPTEEAEVTFAEGQQDIETLYREKKLRAEDLDFWNMYNDREVEVEVIPEEDPTPTPSHEPTEEELSKDGEHTLVIHRDGEREWQEISSNIPLYTYDLTNIKITNGKMSYHTDGKENSWLGVEISKNSGTVDFKKLKESGVDFVMIMLGSRGYESGVISLDENFVTNMTEATNAGLDIGVYFSSQAVSAKEASEEADFVTSNLMAYHITYPVALEMEYIANDDSRTDILDAEKRTQVAETFLSAIDTQGYQPILYGNKTWLLSELIPDKLLQDYDVFLSDQNSIPDYPYQFRMWKYAVSQQVEGVEKEADYIISFVDYTRR